MCVRHQRKKGLAEPVNHSASLFDQRMIGVLALQGAFLEHLAKFAQLGIAAKEVRGLAHDRKADHCLMQFLPRRCALLLICKDATA